MAAPDRMRVLVIGSGWGRHAAHAAARSSSAELSGVVGRGSARTIELAAALAVPAFASIDRALEAARPHVAVVAATERAQPALVECVLRAGCHVLCAHPVAPGAETVRSLARLAESSGRVAVTDYTLRGAEPWRVARQHLDDLGPPLRIALRCPGRALAVAIDLAIGLAGPVRRVSANATYPPHLDERRARSPAAFPPTVLLEHDRGCVTSIVSVPHALPACAHRIEVSTERGRLDVELPAGAVRLVVRDRVGGRVDTLRAAPVPLPGREIFGALMQRHVDAFLAAARDGKGHGVGFEGEAHRRDVWNAIGGRARGRSADGKKSDEGNLGT